jgi:hypothetical protein
MVSICQMYLTDKGTYGSILGGFCSATLECDSVTLVLKTLRGDETLDLGSLGVWLRALLLWLDFATDNEFADL